MKHFPYLHTNSRTSVPAVPTRIVHALSIRFASADLIVTQHSGEGKANQYFVRGFNLDHGTDFRTLVDGMPINQPRHGHGQGYTDLNVIIPEFVRALDYKLGVYHAEVGDFGSAGSAELFLAKRLDLNRGFHRHSALEVNGR